MRFRSCAALTLAAAIASLWVFVRQPCLLGSAPARLRETLPAQRDPSPDATPVLVELFTSEGCSSCPPADALLSRLGRTQPVVGANIIALEEHVDYWDDQGWKDPFSSEAATARQTEYDRAFGGKEIYTPQMIVDGRTEFVGSSGREALRAISGASQMPKPAIHLSWGKNDTRAGQAGDTLFIRVEALANAASADTTQLFLVVTESMLHSDVKRGENAGTALEHNGVVRQLLPLDKVDAPRDGISSTVSVHPAREWNRANLRAVVFVQERRGRQVLAAAAIPFPAQ